MSPRQLFNVDCRLYNNLRMEYLSKLFGSPARVKLLRLFIFNPESVLDRAAILQLSRITPESASRELASLARAGIVNRKNFYKDVVRPGSKKTKKRKTTGWILDQKYPYLEELSRFLHDTLSVSQKDVQRRLRAAGKVKLLVLTGPLIGKVAHGIDILIVGDGFDETLIKNLMRSLEAECGQELCYALLPTDEYLYRRRVGDKLVRDVMEYDHQVLIDKMAV